MAVFDVGDAQPAPYPDTSGNKFCQKLLENSEYKTAVLTHNNIFHLGMRYDNHHYNTLNLLFEHGYKYIPWIMTQTTEYEEAVIYQDKQRLNYLLQHSILIDYRAPNGTTALAKAIITDSPNMLYTLLHAGANPNIPANNTKSLLDVALLYENSAAIILLLASGMGLSKKDIIKLREAYSMKEIEAVITHALTLHTKLNFPAKPVTLELLKIMDELVLTITSKDIGLHGQNEQEDIKIILQTLQDIASTHSDVSERAKIARDKIANYLHVSPPPAVIFRAAKSYEEDVAPLLSLRLTI